MGETPLIQSLRTALLAFLLGAQTFARLCLNRIVA